MGNRLRLSKTKKMEKKLRKKKEDAGRLVIELEMRNAAHRPACEGVYLSHPACNPPYPHDAYEEARQNKAYYDLCRQNVIDGERAELMRKSLYWLKISSILLCITFCWSVIWKISKLGDEYITPSLILLGLVIVSTGYHEWDEGKIKKLDNVK